MSNAVLLSQVAASLVVVLLAVCEVAARVRATAATPSAKKRSVPDKGDDGDLSRRDQQTECSGAWLARAKDNLMSVCMALSTPTRGAS